KKSTYDCRGLGCWRGEPVTLILRRPEVMVPADVLLIYSMMEDSLSKRPRWELEAEKELWRELCLCILSANTLYETAVSAMSQLESRCLLETLMFRQDQRILTTLTKTLDSRLFEPSRLDGTLRRYRFPFARARQIWSTAQLLYSSGKSDSLKSL